MPFLWHCATKGVATLVPDPQLDFNSAPRPGFLEHLCYLFYIRRSILFQAIVKKIDLVISPSLARVRSTNLGHGDN